MVREAAAMAARKRMFTVPTSAPMAPRTRLVVQAIIALSICERRRGRAHPAATFLRRQVFPFERESFGALQQMLATRFESSRSSHSPLLISTGKIRPHRQELYASS